MQDIVTQKNENIWTKARHIMEEISFEIAKKEIRKKNWVFNLNNYWERIQFYFFYPNFFLKK